jgi:general nucleoside transport system permease protein
VIGRLRGWMLAGAVVVAVLVVATVLILIAGADPLTGLQGLIAGVSSSPYRVGELLVGAVPIAIVALTLIPALRAGVFSVGAEGQVIFGAIFATAATLGTAGLFGEGVPAPVYWVIGMVSGALGGAAFALLPAWLAERWHVNIILSTLLLNYIAAGFLGWTLRTWLASGENTATPQSQQLPEASALPDLIPGTRAHIGVLLIIVVAVLFEWWRRTSQATRIGVFAERPRLALRLGTTRARTLYGTMLVSGAGAGVVGWLQVAGVNERLFNSVSGGVGFSGLAVALLGALLPGGILLAALFFSALTAGALGIQSATGTVPSSIADVIKGVLLLGVAAVAGVTARRGAARPAAAPPLTDVASVTPDGEPTPTPATESAGTEERS